MGTHHCPHALCLICCITYSLHSYSIFLQYCCKCYELRPLNNLPFLIVARRIPTVCSSFPGLVFSFLLCAIFMTIIRTHYRKPKTPSGKMDGIIFLSSKPVICACPFLSVGKKCMKCERTAVTTARTKDPFCKLVSAIIPWSLYPSGVSTQRVFQYIFCSSFPCYIWQS